MYDHDGYEPFEPDLTPRSLAAAGWSQEPPPAPQRERPQMVAPSGQGHPVHEDEREQVSQRLWDRLSFQPMQNAPASRLQGGHTPHARLSGMCLDTRDMWGHIGQGASLNMHNSQGGQGTPTMGMQQRLAQCTPARSAEQLGHASATPPSYAEATECSPCLLYTSDAADE